jgi:dihydroorotate dehydrogenase
MADIRNNFVGIKSPNPFWLASAPPTDKAYNVERAFKAGWGGVVWKTLGEEGPPVVNVNGPRYGAIWGADRRLLGLNNIELITDRDLQINLQEMKQVKRDWPDRALIASIMVPCVEEAWKAILPLGRGNRAPTASSSISAARTACRSAAWVPRSARCRNTSKWSCAGASSTRACRSSPS